MRVMTMAVGLSETPGQAERGSWECTRHSRALTASSGAEHWQASGRNQLLRGYFKSEIQE